MGSKEIIKYIAKNKYTKYVQAIEIVSFLIAGYLTYTSLMEGGLMLIVGVVAAIFASESAIEEYKLKTGDNKSGAE